MVNPLTFKVTIPILALSASLFFGAVVTGWYVHRQQHAASELLRRTVQSIVAVEELVIHIRDLRININQYLVTEDPKLLTHVPAMHAELLRKVETARQLAHTSAEFELIDSIREGAEEFDKAYRNISQLVEQRAPFPEVKSQMTKLIDEQITTRILLHAHKYLRLNQQSIQQTIPVNQQAADRVGLGLIALGFLGAVTGLLVGFGFAREYSESLVRLTVPVHDAAGKLNEVLGPIELSMPVGNIEELNNALESLSIKVSDVVIQLQRSQREVLRAEQLAAVGQLAAGVAHEIRNPLTAIKMIVQTAAEQPGGTGITGKSLEILYEQILRQERIITGFLEFARPPRIEPQTFDLGEALESSVLLLTDQATRQRVEIEFVPPPVSPLVSGDSTQIRQVIVNLLVNAIEALPGGGQIRTQVQCWTSAEVRRNTCLNPPEVPQEHPQWGLVAVADNGIGLSEQLGDRIFEPFVSSKDTGMGLGLSICKRIMEQHNGFICARNNPDVGTTFYFCLPISTETALRELPANT